jgi:hypothetical protein
MNKPRTLTTFVAFESCGHDLLNQTTAAINSTIPMKMNIGVKIKKVRSATAWSASGSDAPSSNGMTMSALNSASNPQLNQIR